MDLSALHETVRTTVRSGAAAAPASRGSSAERAAARAFQRRVRAAGGAAKLSPPGSVNIWTVEVRQA